MYRQPESIIPNYAPFLDVVDYKNYVELDDDGIYLAQDTREYNFDKNAGTVLITTKRTDFALNTTTTTTEQYFFNEVNGVTPFGNTGNTVPPSSIEQNGARNALLYLKGTREDALLNDHFIGFRINWENNDCEVGRKVIITKDIAEISDSLIGAGDLRFALLSAVNIDPYVMQIMETIANANKGLVTLDFTSYDFRFVPTEQQIYYFDVTNRLIFMAANYNLASGTGARAGTNYMRFKIANPQQYTTITNTVPLLPRGERVGLFIVSNSRDDLRFNGVHPVTGSPMRFEVHPSGVITEDVYTPLADEEISIGCTYTDGSGFMVDWKWVYGVGLFSQK